MKYRKQFIITNNVEYEEVMNYLHSFKYIPKIGGSFYIQWLELKKAIEDYEHNKMYTNKIGE